MSDYLSGVSASGASASQQTGAPPPASGGPNATVSGGSTVSAGGSNSVQVSASTPFQTVDVSIGGGGSSVPSALRLFVPQATTGASVNGFWQLKLPAPTTSVVITYTVSPTIPVADNAQFTAAFTVITPSGAVGAAATQTLIKLKGTTFTGVFSGQRTAVQTTAGATAIVTCTWLTTFNVTLRMILDPQAPGTTAGTAEMNGSETTVITGSPGCSSPLQTGAQAFPFTTLPVTTTGGNLMISGQTTGGTDGNNTVTNTFAFTGTLSGGAISGMATYAISGRGVNNGVVTSITGSTTVPVMLN